MAALVGFFEVEVHGDGKGDRADSVVLMVNMELVFMVKMMVLL